MKNPTINMMPLNQRLAISKSKKMKQMSEKQDMGYDKKMKVKENSGKDKKMDKKYGVKK